ncbi:Uncharacterised protein [Mycobacterium tuberculosis]|nr:Uncharacterised protein [Mycobacterium tuberculosis]
MGDSDWSENLYRNGENEKNGCKCCCHFIDAVHVYALLEYQFDRARQFVDD